MKKIVMLLLAATITIGIVASTGCGGYNDPYAHTSDDD
jgi:hypothetical protein